jgi:hypothetical protein
LTQDLWRHARDDGRKVILGGPCEIHKPRRGAGQNVDGVNACGTGCNVAQNNTVHGLAWVRVRMLKPLSRHSMGDKMAEPMYLHNLRANICASIWARRCLQSNTNHSRKINSSCTNCVHFVSRMYSRLYQVGTMRGSFVLRRLSLMPRTEHARRRQVLENSLAK